MTSDRYARGIEAIDAANREDPTREVYQGQDLPREVAYSLRMTAWLERLDPAAPEALRLAVRAQHLRRFSIPRDSYPEGRHSYLRWRRDCQQMHATEAGRVLEGAGYDPETIDHVRSLIMKHRIQDDPQSQTVEDTACLVFLEGYLGDFCSRHAEEKVIDILRKTWRKMSPRARDLALQMDLEKAPKALLEKALSL